MMVYWFVFWDRTSLTVAAESLEEAEEELMRRDALLLRDWTARVCEGKGLRSVDAYLKGEGIPKENVLAVICW